MKTALMVLVLVGLARGVFASEQAALTATNVHSQLASYHCEYVEPPPKQRKNLDAALIKMKLMSRENGMCNTIEEAIALLHHSISIVIVRKSTGGINTWACTEYKDLFWFSGLGGQSADDHSFSHGWAVRRGTGEIYHWGDTAGGEAKAQPPGGTNAASPRRSP